MGCAGAAVLRPPRAWRAAVATRAPARAQREARTAGAAAAAPEVAAAETTYRAPSAPRQGEVWARLAKSRAEFPVGGDRFGRSEAAAAARDEAIATRTANAGFGKSAAHRKLQEADGPFGKSAEHEAVRQAKAVQLDRLAPWLDSATAVHAAPHVMCVGPREWALSLTLILL
eukprot:PRCOL_00005123-RA